MTEEREIPFDLWCEIAASSSGRPRDELLDRLDAEDISNEAWSAANIRFLLLIADGLQRGDRALADRYAARCLEARKVGAPPQDSASSPPKASEPNEKPVLLAPPPPTSEAEDATVLAPPKPAPRDATLPFKRPEPGTRLPLVAPPPTPLPEQSGATLAVDAGFVAEAGTPFEREKLAAWTVERYAAFFADRSRLAPSILEKTYGAMTEQDEVALLVHFKRRFRDEPGLKEKWERLVAERAAQSRGW